jgi:two-component system NtrC family sensor kinase
VTRLSSIPLGVRILIMILPLSLLPAAAGGSWTASVLAMSLALLGAGLIATAIVRPLSALSRGTERIAKGDFDVRLAVDRGDEIGQLTESFNTMAAALAAYRDELVRAEGAAALGRLASVVAHEVRNPLNAIRGCIDYLRLKRPDDELVAHHAEIIAAEIETLDAFVGDFLQFTRLQPPRPAAVNVPDVLRSRIALHEAEARARGVTIELSADPGVPEVRGDPQQLARVFENVARNAFEAMPTGGSLRITVSRAGERVEIAFADTGPGIPDSVAGGLFTPFFTTKPNGTGLGLPICRRIVELHGGSISFASRVGEGTTFRVTLPVSTGE